MTSIVFVRHGETAHNVEMVITSRAPGNPLTERGADQMRELAPRLWRHRPVVIYASRLLRSRQSAEILRGELDLPVHYREDLREIDVGQLEGRADRDSFARFDSSFDRWYLEADPDYPVGPEGESGTSAIARVRRVVDEIARNHTDACVLVIGHATVLQLALTYLSANLTPASGHGRWIANAWTVVVDVRSDAMYCVEWCGEPVAVGPLRPVTADVSEESSWAP